MSLTVVSILEVVLKARRRVLDVSRSGRRLRTPLRLTPPPHHLQQDVSPRPRAARTAGLTMADVLRELLDDALTQAAE